jgi:uncharacterized membrane protein affecting hemolysin expression
VKDGVTVLVIFDILRQKEMETFKLIACQAKSINAYKNTKTTLMKCCANIYFNKQCLDPISHSTSLVHGLDIVYDSLITAETYRHYNYHSFNKLVVLDGVILVIFVKLLVHAEKTTQKGEQPYCDHGYKGSQTVQESGCHLQIQHTRQVT